MKTIFLFLMLSSLIFSQSMNGWVELSAVVNGIAQDTGELIKEYKWDCYAEIDCNEHPACCCFYNQEFDYWWVYLVYCSKHSLAIYYPIGRTYGITISDGKQPPILNGVFTKE